MADDAPEPRPLLRPYTLVATAGMMVGGVFLAFYFLPDDWSVLRRLAAGVVGGVSAVLLVIANRYIGRSESI